MTLKIAKLLNMQHQLKNVALKLFNIYPILFADQVMFKTICCFIVAQLIHIRTKEILVFIMKDNFKFKDNSQVFFVPHTLSKCSLF